jgi:hypothetical protein
MVRSPAGRRAPRAGGRTTDQWLEVPGWRRPVDTLLVLAVTFATAWVGLVVIPAAANSDSGTVTDRTPTENDASPPTADPTQDPSQWFAGPVYTGGPAASTTAQAVATQAVVLEQPKPAPRAAPKRTTTHAAPRTTPRLPAPTTTVAAAAAAAGPPSVLTTTTTPTATTTSEPPPTSPSSVSQTTTTSSTTSSAAPPSP